MAPLLLIVLVSLLPLFSCVGYDWVLPTQSQLVPVNSKVDVKVSSAPILTNSVFITLSCGSLIVVSESITTNIIYEIKLPSGYTGTCAITCDKIVIPRNFIVEPSLTFYSCPLPIHLNNSYQLVVM